MIAMFKPKKELLQELAKLAVISGANVQKGQALYINAPIEAAELVRECTKMAYEVGAESVSVNYIDEHKTRLDYEYQATETLSYVPEWKINKKQYEIDTNACYIHITGKDPDLLSGIDTDKIMKVALATSKVNQKFQYYTMNNYGQWTIIAWPNLAWAKKVFPNKSDDDAMEALWQAILSASRVEVNKTLDNWVAHSAEIKKHCELMNAFNFKLLHFKNSLGTDLTVGLIKDHIWAGGKEKAIGKYKVDFNPNIPTEEVFTMPDRRRIYGKVVSTKPLSYNGNIISKFELTFADGQITEVKADDNQKVLEDFVKINYVGKNFETIRIDDNDELHVFINNVVGTVESGYLIGYWGRQIDITEQKRAEKSNEIINSFLKAANASEEILLVEKNYSMGIKNALLKIGNSVETEEVGIYENIYDIKAKKHLIRENINLRVSAENEIVNQNHPDDIEFPFSWFEDLYKGNNIYININDIPDKEEKSILKKWGATNVLLLPILTGGILWGFVKFKNIYLDKLFGETELSVLRSFANAIGGAINKEISEKS